MDERRKNARAVWGWIVLIGGSLPVGLLIVGMLGLGLLGLLAAVTPSTSLDLGHAFGSLFAIVLLPSAVVVLVLLVLSRLKKPVLAIIGSSAQVLLSFIGVLILLFSDAQGRIDTGLQAALWGSIFLVGGLTGFVGGWLRDTIGRGWAISGGAATLVYVSIFLLTGLLAPAQLAAKRQVFEGHESAVREVDWAPDGESLVSASWDGTAIIWGMDGSIKRRLDHGDVMLSECDWSPDGSMIGTVYDTTIVIWDAVDGTQIEELGGDFSRVGDIGWSPDSTMIAAATDKGLVAWKVETGEEVNRMEESWFTVLGDSVLWSGDEKLLAYEIVEKQLILWDPVTDDWETVIAGFDGEDSVTAAWSGDEARLAVWYRSKEIAVWNMASGAKTLTMDTPNETIESMDWSPDGAEIATVSGDNISIWDAATGERSRQFRAHGDRVWQVAWSPDGTMLASANLDGTVMVWDVE